MTDPDTRTPGTPKLLLLQILLLAGVSLVLRLSQLGYSNFQGDEILAMCRLADFEHPLQFLAYLLGQQKGPVQFAITCAYSLLDPAFSSEAALRLPFALANLAALACFFLLVRRLFGLQPAIYAGFLFAVNGIFIAFGRIVQYQSFVILGGVAGLLSLLLALQYERWRIPGLYLAALCAAGSLLAHFDAAFFLPPMAVLVLHGWWKLRRTPGFARLRSHVLAAGALFVLLVLAFYVPYALNLGSYQTNHWENRFTGEPTDFLRLFQFYNPGPLLWTGLALVLAGLTRIRNTLAWQVTLAWLVPPLVFMTLIFKDSRTHAYTYLLPLTIVAALGLDLVAGWLVRRLGGRSSSLVQAGILAVFLLFSYLGYSVFVDHDPEYPWYPKQVLGMQLAGGNLTGTFGFPYRREWREIGAWFRELPAGTRPVVVTNEKRQFAAFYLPAGVRNQYRYSRKQFPGQVEAPDGLYLLVVQQPQSWMDRLWGLSPEGWRERFVPLQEFVDERGRPAASLYYLTQEQIRAEFP